MGAFSLGKFYLYNFSEMVESMKNVASLDKELTMEERNLLSVAYKNVIGARRASWRIISSLEQKEEGKAAEEKMKMIKEYRKVVSWPLTFRSTGVILGWCVEQSSTPNLRNKSPSNAAFCSLKHIKSEMDSESFRRLIVLVLGTCDAISMLIVVRVQLFCGVTVLIAER